MKRKILVLEDEENIRSFLVLNLKRSGYEVIEAETGEIALEKYHENQDIAVAVLDVMLPGIDGYEVCRAMRGAGYQAGVIMLTKCMANEWAQRGVRVNAICPGFTDTPLTARRLSTPNDPAVAKWIGGTPMGRVAQPDEMVGLVLYFASEASTFTTGAVLSVDGGYTCL